MPVGAGRIDIPAIIAAADESVLQWIIVGNNNSDRDMLQYVAESDSFLMREDLAEGNNNHRIS